MVILKDRGRIVIESHECTIQATGPPQVDVYVHYYPFEAPDGLNVSGFLKVSKCKEME